MLRRKVNVGLLLACGTFLLLSSCSNFEMASKRLLPTTAEPNEFLRLSDCAAKTIDLGERVNAQSDSGVPARWATVQWRCDITNVSKGPVDCELGVKLLDGDGFVLAESDELLDQLFGRDPGELAPGERRRVWGEIEIAYRRLKDLASCRLLPKASPVDQGGSGPDRGF
ncbi:MAG TPA: hypothetical protein VNE39_13535 [Planctomycetota bacterium]|nr:hypothetical protein [Planctomycetota bacterium]